MKSSTKDVVRGILICVFVMVVLPLTYRIWMIRHSRPASPKRTLVQRIDKAVEDNVLRFLQTPPAKWPSGVRELEPQLFAWLKAHEDTVLPWEWTDEARRKDPDGYRKLWLALFGEQEAALKERLESGRRMRESLELEILQIETTYVHRTNQLAGVRACVAASSFPMAISYERQSESEYWGRITKTETHQVASREELHAEDGWFSAEERLAADEGSRIAVRRAAILRSSERTAAVRQVLSRVEMAIALVSQTPPVSDRVLMKELLCLIKFG